MHTIDRVKPGATRTTLSEAVVERETVHQASLEANYALAAIRDLERAHHDESVTPGSR